MKKVADLRDGGILIELSHDETAVLEKVVSRLSVLTKADLVEREVRRDGFVGADLSPIFRAMDVWLHSIWPSDRLRELADELDALLGLKEKSCES